MVQNISFDRLPVQEKLWISIVWNRNLSGIQDVSNRGVVPASTDQIQQSLHPKRFHTLLKKIVRKFSVSVQVDRKVIGKLLLWRCILRPFTLADILDHVVPKIG